MTSAPSESHDVVVVGGRCAGSATARLLAARGHDVVVVERATLPSDTLSTHGIARGGVVQLHRWGLLDRVLADGAPPVRRVTFGIGGSEQTRVVKETAGVDVLVAPRRTRLDLILASAAADAGADVRTGITASGLLRGRDGRVTGVVTRDRAGRELLLRARHVVGADGLRSGVARGVGAATVRGFDADLAVYYAYVDRAPWPAFEFHVAPRAFAGVFPTHDGAACVWLIRSRSDQEHLRGAGPDRAPALVEAIGTVATGLGDRVRGGRVVGPVRGWRAAPNVVRTAHGPGWSLVGDAGYHRDPITGHGITDAFRDAELLADALHDLLSGGQTEADALAGYQAARDAALAPTYRLTEELSRLPEPDRFLELQVELARAIDLEARQLASRPAPAGLTAAPAA